MNPQKENRVNSYCRKTKWLPVPKKLKDLSLLAWELGIFTETLMR